MPLLPCPRSPALAAWTLVAAFGLAMRAPAREDGHWRLYAIERSTPRKLSAPARGISLAWRGSGRPVRGGVTTRIDYFGKGGNDAFAITWSWSPVPVVLVPGEELKSTLRGTVGTYPSWKFGHVGLTRPYLKPQFRWPHETQAWGYGPGFVDAQNRGVIVQFHSADKNKTPAITVHGRAEVPDGSAGRELALVMEIDHLKWWNYTYRYRWESGPAPAPDRRRTIPPGVDRIDGRVPPDKDDRRRDNRRRDDRSKDDQRKRDLVTGLTLAAAKETATAGETVRVPIRLLEARDIGNLNLEVHYDPSVLRLEGKATKGELVGDALFDSNPGLSGRCLLGFAAKRGIDGSGTIAWLLFRAIGSPGQRSALTLKLTRIDTTADTQPRCQLLHGEIQIRTKAGTKIGDADGDGKITLADAMLALRMSVQLIPERRICDVDRSGDVTSRDARLLIDLASK